MFYKILLTVLIVFEVSNSAFGRTPQDVINDFEPVFQQIHQKFLQYENKTLTEVYPMIDNVTQDVIKENDMLTSTLQKTRLEIEKKVWDILKDEGMTNHIDLIPHCIANLNKTENTLIAKALGGQRVCVKLALDKVTSTSSYIKTLLNELQNEHEILEVTREECGKMSLPYDVQTCLINDLYLFYPNYLQDVSKEIEKRVEIVQEDVKNTQEEFDKCDGFIKEGIRNDLEIIFYEFKQCVIEAALP